MIEVDHLTKRYGPRAAVEDLSFEVGRGEIIGFLGPNGAGKSTTLRMLTGYLAPTAGRIRIDGIDAIAHSVEARKRIGYMPESVPLYGEMRVEEYLRYRAALKEVPRRAIKPRVERALELAHVAEVRNRIIGQLSKGYRSRVGLADVLVADPPLLVLDEPTAGLDPNQIRQVRDLIRGLAGEKTVFLSTHILPEVESTCDRVLIIHRGRLVSTGTPGSLRGAGEGHRLFVVEARGQRDTVEEVLRRTAGVREIADVAALEGEGARAWYRVRLQAEGDADAEAIFRAVAKAGLSLRELRTEQTSLEDVFTRLTHEEARDSEPAPEAESSEAEPAEEGDADATSDAGSADGTTEGSSKEGGA